MASTRQEKFSRLVQRNLAEVFQKDMQHDFGGRFLTISEVETTGDLGICYVYLSVLLAKDKEGLLQDVRQATGKIRNLLGKRIRHQVKSIPELRFFLDESYEQGQRIEALLSKLDIPPEDPDEGEE